MEEISVEVAKDSTWILKFPVKAPVEALADKPEFGVLMEIERALKQIRPVSWMLHFLTNQAGFLVLLGRKL